MCVYVIFIFNKATMYVLLNKIFTGNAVFITRTHASYFNNKDISYFTQKRKK